MNKLTLILIAVTVIILGGGAYFISKPQPVNPILGYEYYWGDGCPHCKIVADFFDTWEGKDKINQVKYEVWNNPKYAAQMAQRAAKCNIPKTGMGVPFLVTPDGKCLSGDQPIIELYKSLTF